MRVVAVLSGRSPRRQRVESGGRDSLIGTEGAARRPHCWWRPRASAWPEHTSGSTRSSRCTAVSVMRRPEARRWHQSAEPRNEVERFEHERDGAVAPGLFHGVAQPAIVELGEAARESERRKAATTDAERLPSRPSGAAAARPKPPALGATARRWAAVGCGRRPRRDSHSRHRCRRRHRCYRCCCRSSRPDPSRPCRPAAPPSG